MGSNKLGEFIRGKRKSMGLSVRKLADIVNLSYSYIAQLERGIDPRSKKPISPTVESFIKIAKGLNVHPVDLFKYAYEDDLKLDRENKLPIPDNPKYKDYSGTLEEEYARKGLSPQTQKEILDAAVSAVKEARKRYNKPRK